MGLQAKRAKGGMATTFTTGFKKGQRQPDKGSCGPGGDVRLLCKRGGLEEALHILDSMDRGNIQARSGTYVSLLQICISMKALTEGKRVHAHIINSGFKADVSLGNTLVNMYAKCGSIDHACRVFCEMPKRDVVSWTAMIAGCVKNGQSEMALKLFQRMQSENVKPDEVTFASVLKACASLVALERGKQIHACIVKSGFESDVFVGSALVDMYAKCGSVVHARRVFDKMPGRNVVSWTAMIAGYCQHEHGQEALTLFWQMQCENVKPDKVAFASVLKACATLGDLEEGKKIHSCVMKSGFESDVFVGKALMNMYCKCGRALDAHCVFERMPQQNVIPWTAIIAGYAQHGHGNEALRLFQQMQWEGVKPNKVTFISVLKACDSQYALGVGKWIHANIIKSGFELDAFVGSALVDIYAKCGNIECAQHVFDRIPERDVVLWTAMISAYVQHGQGEDALRLFWQMQCECAKPDKITFISVLRACTCLASLEQGKQIHACILEIGFESDIFVGNSLVDMYAKCGSIKNACQVFDKMPRRNVVSWNVMISGYAQHGCAKEALRLIGKMQQEGMKLDHVTFISALSACSHAGLVDEGRRYFDSINRDHGITPAGEHYACMVDLLGRTGYLEEAYAFVSKMPFQPNSVVWMALLGACRVHAQMDLAENALGCVLELEPQNAAAFVLLSNIYASANRWNNKAKVRKMMDSRGVKMDPGHSCIEVNNEIHAFVADDTAHPQTVEIYAELKRLSLQMAEAGYEPDTRFVLHDVEQQQKELSLSHHSEKLAIAFGLINLPSGMPIFIIKSLRVCGDCHTATKFISKLTRREVIVRDAIRFHCFKDGVCSCGDYW